MSILSKYSHLLHYNELYNSWVPKIIEIMISVIHTSNKVSVFSAVWCQYCTQDSPTMCSGPQNMAIPTQPLGCAS